MYLNTPFCSKLPVLDCKRAQMIQKDTTKDLIKSTGRWTVNVADMSSPKHTGIESWNSSFVEIEQSEVNYAVYRNLENWALSLFE